MAQPHGEYTDFEDLRDQAVTLRRAGLSRHQVHDRLPEGEPPPE